MDKIAYLPLFICFYLLRDREPKFLFAYYFIPIVAFFPVYYQSKVVQGVPEFSFWSAALFPIFAAWLFRKNMEGYSFSVLDVIILAHIVLIFVSQWYNSSYKEAQKVLFNDLMARMFPYLLAKAYFTDPENRIRILKTMVFAAAFLGLYMIFEMKMYFNIFDDSLRKLWPFSVPWDIAMKRSGIKRAYTSFGHPICAGNYFAMLAPIAIFLWKGGYFRPTLLPSAKDSDYAGYRMMLAIMGIIVLIAPLSRKFNPAMVLSILLGCSYILLIMKKGTGDFNWGRLLAFLCIGGGLASISRAPIAGIFLSFILIWFGWSKQKLILGLFLGIILTVGGIVFIPKFIAYISVTRATAETEDQRNAAYRNEMILNYKEVLDERPNFGWGRFTVPVVKGQASIDNEYLGMALASGKIPTFFYILMLLWVLVRLLIFVLTRRGSTQEARLAWCLLAAWISNIFILATVYAGTQTIQYVYMLAGIAETLVASRQPMPVPGISQIQAVIPERKLAYNFSRTL